MKFLITFFFATIFFLLFTIYSNADNYDIQNVQNGICECVNNDCGCCAQLHVEFENINAKLCTNFTYFPKELGISATISYNDYTLINVTISAINPPPICILRYEKIKMEICLHFYNMNYTGCFSGCAEIEVSFFHVLPLKKLKLGCFGCRRSNHLYNFLLNKLHRYKSEINQHKKQPEVVLI